MTILTITRHQFDSMFHSAEEAIARAQDRRRDANLARQVSEFLQGDLPDYLGGNRPMLYLARHVATPNAETMHFLDSMRCTGARIVIGQDDQDKFVSVNAMKRALGRMPILSGPLSRSGPRPHVLRRHTVVDFASSDGHPIHGVRTLWGEPLMEFHNRLFAKFVPGTWELVQDAPWIDRNSRGDLRAHYERLLALFVCHGVLCEDYWLDDSSDTSERWFVSEVLYPAHRATVARFGVPPLLVHLNLSFVDSLDLCFGYSQEVGDHISECLARTPRPCAALDPTSA